MSHLKSLLCLSAAVLGGLQLPAQTVTGTLVTITTSVPGKRFSVDGTNYRSSAALVWASGSKHLLGIPPGDDVVTNPGVMTTFTGWASTSGSFSTDAQTITVTADPSITGYVAMFTQQYQVSLRYADGRGKAPTGVDATCGAVNSPTSTTLPGVVSLGGICYWSDYTIWMAEGPLSFLATPNPGYAFAGVNLNNATSNSYVQTLNITGPLNIVVRFATSKRTQFITDPAGLNVLVDGQQVPTPTALPCPDRETLTPTVQGGPTPLCFGEFDFLPGSTHIIGAPTPQKDKVSKYWVFSAWTNGGGQNATYVVPTVGPEPVVTAKFVAGATASLVSAPAGFKLVVDGRSNWPSMNFIWGVGLKHTVSAPAEQTDKSGRKYVFVSWSNGGTQTQDVVMPAGGLRLVANYQRLNRVTLQSNVPGLSVLVDGVACTMPCNVDRAAGATVVVTPSQSIPVSDVTRYDFTGWVGGGTGAKTITLSTEYQAFSLNYVTMNRLLTASDPAGGVDIVTQPGSGDGYYPSSAQLVVTAKPHPGYKFIRWDGDLSGTYPIGYLDMSGPRVVRVILNRVPYIAPAGVRNAAGETPVTGVAAGSLISIFGENLADKLEVGSSSPLAQTLGGVVVQVEDRLLAMVYVSPQQINALLPIDMAEGDHKVVVKRTGQEDITGQFTVIRNAPGLFANGVDTKLYAVALHEDGTAITTASPARRGERVTLLGTGFGPYDKRPVEGFALPATPQINLVDNAEVLAGDLHLPTVWSGAQPGFVGVAASQFRIADELPSGEPEIRLAVNGVESNKLLLPVE
jgi:uncharacterized protein (TIGR03437 family)